MMMALRHAVRGPRRAPGSTVVAAATLALGIGVNAGIYALADAVLFRPLAPNDPDRARWITRPTRGRPDVTGFIFSYFDSRDARERAGTLDAMAPAAPTPFVMRADGSRYRTPGEAPQPPVYCRSRRWTAGRRP